MSPFPIPVFKSEPLLTASPVRKLRLRTRLGYRKVRGTPLTAGGTVAIEVRITGGRMQGPRLFEPCGEERDVVARVGGADKISHAAPNVLDDALWTKVRTGGERGAQGGVAE